MYRHRLIASAAAALATIPLPGHAAETIAPITVTATRSAETAEQSLASVTVVDREEIERSQTSSMGELLSRQPGIEFTRNGGRGTNSGIFLRGTESDHVLVLVDGVEVGAATSGAPSLEDLPLANVERIEIVRGPRSSLYGSRAIGGVIQIFTREGEGGHANVGAGTHDRRQGAAGYGSSNGGTSFSINASAEETEGIDARENDCMLCADEPDDDGYKNRSVNARLSQDINKALTVSGRILATDSKVEFDGVTENRTDSQQRIYSGRIDARLTSNWNTHVQLSRATDDSDNFLDDQRGDSFDTTRNAFAWQNEVTVSNAQSVTMGIDAESVEIDSNLSFGNDERDTTGIYAQHQWIGDTWSSEFSLRSEDYDQFNDPTTGTIAVGYRVDASVQAFASYGTAFRAPTFNELYYPGYGNPDLEPEESRTLEAGLRGRYEAMRWEATAYRTEIDKLIDFAPKNVDQARMQGIEVIVGVTARDWDGDVAFELKDAEDSDTGNELARRSQFGLKAGLTRDFGDWSIGSDVKVQGDRFDDAANTVPLDAYALLDLRANWDFAPDWTVRAKIANVGDTEYTLADTYNTLGRTALLELAWRPGTSDG